MKFGDKFPTLPAHDTTFEFPKGMPRDLKGRPALDDPHQAINRTDAIRVPNDHPKIANEWSGRVRPPRVIEPDFEHAPPAHPYRHLGRVPRNR
jgi:hypothetical protein